MRTEKYLSNLATTFIQQLRVPQSMGDSQSGPQDIYEQFGEKIKAKLLQMNPETLGRIASFGLAYEGERTKTAMYLVHCGSYLGKYLSGSELLTEIATTAVVAEIYDVLRSSEYWLEKWAREHPTSSRRDHLGSDDVFASEEDNS